MTLRGGRSAADDVVTLVEPPGWRLIGIAHSADSTRVNRGRRTVRFTTAADPSRAPHHGFRDARWALSRSGRLTLLAQVVDHDGTLRVVYASPPSPIVDLPGQARPQAAVLGRILDSGPSASRLGFALHSDARPVDDVGGRVSTRAWMATLPYWLIVLLCLPMPLPWLRFTRRRRDTSVPQPGHRRRACSTSCAKGFFETATGDPTSRRSRRAVCGAARPAVALRSYSPAAEPGRWTAAENRV